MSADTTKSDNRGDRSQFWKSIPKLAGLAIVSRIVFLLFYCLHSSYRYRYFQFSLRQQAMQQHPQKSFLLALWHEQLFASLGGHSFQGVSPIISLSKDGEIVSYIAQKMGMDPVRGSSNRGGKQAKDNLEDKIRAGLAGAITIDGPRGPRRKVKIGIFHISHSTHSLIVPSAAVANRFWTLRSWDQFKIPKPFATIAIIYGEPMTATDLSSRPALRELSIKLAAEIERIEQLGAQLINNPTAKWTTRAEVLKFAQR